MQQSNRKLMKSCRAGLTFDSVLLPDPFLPMMACTSPSRTAGQGKEVFVSSGSSGRSREGAPEWAAGQFMQCYIDP